MRTMAMAVLLAGLAMGGTALQASEGYEDVAKLAQAGLGEDVLLAFVNSSNVPYDLTVDEIVRLNDLGVTDAVIQQIILVGKERRDAIAAGAAPNDQAPAPAEAAPADEGPLMTPRDGALEPVYTAQPAAYEPEPTYSYAPPEENLDTSFFYESLTPYGTWYREPDYGWVWQPTVAVTSVSWRPYCDRGRWIWTDHGWYWHSYYSWGWAPFHYGRWVHTSHRRWCWVPDTVWAPAWVHWRSCDDYYGWAPLPPRACYRPGIGFTWYGKNVSFSFNFGLGHDHYSFVPCNRFLAHDLAPVTVVNNTQIVNIYNNSTIVKDGYKTDKSRYINRGIAVDKVEKTNDIKKIETVEIAENNVKTGEPIKSDLRDGKKLVVYRPTIKEKVREEPPVIAEHHKAELEKQKAAEAAKTGTKTGDAGESGKRPIRNLPGRRDVNKTAEGNEANEATETATPAKTEKGENTGKPEKTGKAENDGRGGKTGRAELSGDDGPGKSDAAKQSIEDRRRAAEELRQKALAAYEAQKKNIEDKRKANEAQKDTRDVYDPQKGRIIRGRATPATPATPAQPATPATPSKSSDSGASKATPATPTTPAQPASQWPYNPGTSTQPAQPETPAQPGTKGASTQPATPAQPADGSGKVYDPRTGRTTRGSDAGSNSGSSKSSQGSEGEQNVKGGSTSNTRGGRTTRGSEENAPGSEQPKAPVRQGRTKKAEPAPEESATEK